LYADEDDNLLKGLLNTSTGQVANELANYKIHKIREDLETLGFKEIDISNNSTFECY
jgi:hypothetical protein